jgi:hypothetical protein
MKTLNKNNRLKKRNADSFEATHQTDEAHAYKNGLKHLGEDRKHLLSGLVSLFSFPYQNNMLNAHLNRLS